MQPTVKQTEKLRQRTTPGVQSPGWPGVASGLIALGGIEENDSELLRRIVRFGSRVGTELVIYVLCGDWEGLGRTSVTRGGSVLMKRVGAN